MKTFILSRLIKQLNVSIREQRLVLNTPFLFFTNQPLNLTYTYDYLQHYLINLLPDPSSMLRLK